MKKGLIQKDAKLNNSKGVFKEFQRTKRRNNNLNTKNEVNIPLNLSEMPLINNQALNA